MEHLLYSLLSILNAMSPYVLLGFLIAGLLRVYVSPDIMSRHLSGSGWESVVKAALIGIPLPLCSCGVLPTAVSLRRSGASKAASTSFLIATPQTGVDSIAATYSLLGPAFAVMRPVAALAGSLFGGLLVGKFGDDSETAAAGESQACPAPETQPAEQISPMKRLSGALRYGFVDMVQSVGKWLVIGLLIAAVITVFVPDSLFLGLSRYPILAMLVMVAVAVPMYICATGSIPIALSLILKGLTPGVGFVLLMAGPAANFASVILLKKTMGTRATALYVGSVIISAIAFGMLIDYLLPRSWFVPDMSAPMAGAHCHMSFSIWETICSVILTGLLVNAFIRNRKSKHNHNISDEEMETVYKIKGMMCVHCKNNVEKNLAQIPGVTSVEVDLSAGTATVCGEADPAAVIDKINALGYEYVQ